MRPNYPFIPWGGDVPVHYRPTERDTTYDFWGDGIVIPLSWCQTDPDDGNRCPECGRGYGDA